MPVRPRYLRNRNFDRLRYSKEFLSWLAEQAVDYSVTPEEVFNEFLRKQGLTFEQIESDQADLGESTVVFALLGQSNMRGRAGDDGGETYPATLLQYTQAGELEAPSGGLDHPVNGSGEPSIGLGFALDYQAANPDDTIVLVPHAVGGTGFASNDWNPGDTLYQEAVNRINTVMSENPTFIFGGFLWHQGAADADNLSEVAAYEAAFVSMVDAMRSDVITANSATPFVAGEGSIPHTKDPLMQDINAIIARTGDIIDYGAYGAASGLATSDGQHFNAEALREMGSRYYTAYISALSDTPNVPEQVTGVVANGGDSTVNLSWSSVSSAVSYNVRRSTVSGGPYSLIASVTNTTYADSSVTNDVNYFYVIDAVNATGTGPQSTEVSAIPTASVGLSVLAVDYEPTTFQANPGGGSSLPLTTVDGASTVVVVHRASSNGNNLPTAVNLGGQSATLISSALESDTGHVSAWLVNAVGASNSVEVTTPNNQGNTNVSVISLSATPTFGTPVSANQSNTTGYSVPSVAVNADELLLVATTCRGGDAPTYSLSSGTLVPGSNWSGDPRAAGSIYSYATSNPAVVATVAHASQANESITMVVSLS